MHKNIFAIFLIFVSIVCGSTMGVLIKIAQFEANIYLAAFYRFSIGFIIIFPYIFYIHRLFFDQLYLQQILKKNNVSLFS